MTISNKWCGCFLSLYDPYFGIFCGQINASDLPTLADNCVVTYMTQKESSGLLIRSIWWLVISICTVTVQRFATTHNKIWTKKKERKGRNTNGMSLAGKNFW